MQECNRRLEESDIFANGVDSGKTITGGKSRDDTSRGEGSPTIRPETKGMWLSPIPHSTASELEELVKDSPTILKTVDKLRKEQKKAESRSGNTTFKFP